MERNPQYRMKTGTTSQIIDPEYCFEGLRDEDYKNCIELLKDQKIWYYNEETEMVTEMWAAVMGKDR